MILSIKSRKYGLINFIIDDEDYLNIKDYKWCLSKESKNSSNLLFYAVGFRSPRNKTLPLIRLHRLIMNASKGESVDHINRNTLDNRKANLRITNHTGNMRNLRPRNRFYPKGVSRTSNGLKWRARIYFNKKQLNLGIFDSPEAAEAAYLQARREFGLDLI